MFTNLWLQETGMPSSLQLQRNCMKRLIFTSIVNNLIVHFFHSMFCSTLLLFDVIAFFLHVTQIFVRVGTLGLQKILHCEQHPR